MYRIRIKGTNVYATARRSIYRQWFIVMLDDGRTLDLHTSSIDIIAKG